MSCKPIALIPEKICSNLKGILTDIDDTLTLDGELHARAYVALEKAKQAGLWVVVVTGRPAGWVDHIARMWPVDGVIGENGAFYFYRQGGRLKKRFLQSPAVRTQNRKRLEKVAREILKKVPGSALASDQDYRACDLAIDYREDVQPLDNASVQRILSIFKQRGATAKLSSIHVNGWYGNYDKLYMTKKFFREIKAFDLNKNQNRFLFLGDSPNDEPLFAFFTHGVGVSNVRNFLAQMKQKPTWICEKPGSFGFEEAVDLVLAKRRR